MEPGEQEVEYERKLARQRKVELIRENLRLGRRAGNKGRQVSGPTAGGGVGLGLGIGLGLKPPMSIGAQDRGGTGTSGRNSPFLPPSGAGASGSEWVVGKEMRALFVRPSEVVYVLGAE